MADLNALPLPRLFDALAADGGIDRALDAALAEDLGSLGDITTQSMNWGDRPIRAVLAAREAGVVAGLAAVTRFLARPESRGVASQLALADGDRCTARQSLAELTGNHSAMLGVERIILNMLGRLSGIATLTRQFVDAVAGTLGAVICDTRKTTPGMRNLEKYAVRCGGGTLHRLGLFDAALYKDNHLAGIPLKGLAGTLSTAAARARLDHHARFVEVEVDSLDQLKQIAGIKRGLVDMVLLDNMSLDGLRQAVAMRDADAPHLQLEASGGVRLENVRAIAETGVDRISVGAITHGVCWLDIGLDIT